MLNWLAFLALFIVAAEVEAEDHAAQIVLFGTTHGHSNWSIDAFGVGNQTLGPEVAFEFARGDQVTHLNGNEVQLKRPLDFFMLSRSGHDMDFAVVAVFVDDDSWHQNVKRLGDFASVGGFRRVHTKNGRVASCRRERTRAIDGHIDGFDDLLRQFMLVSRCRQQNAVGSQFSRNLSSVSGR